MTAPAAQCINAVVARSIAPRLPLTVSQWADAERVLSGKGSAEPGRWRTHRNPPMREPMDCMSARNPVREVVLMWPIQYGKTECAINALGYTMDHNPGPIMICLPGEVAMNKWVQQKLNPMLQETPTVRQTLTSLASRDSSNTATFKDFSGGQLYLEHAGSPTRLKSTTVRTLIVDELDDFAANLRIGGDPVDMLNGRTSAFAGTSKRLYIGTPTIRGISRVENLWLESDQRHYHVPCPDCGHWQPLEWNGLHWSPNGDECWYSCRECGVVIRDSQKTAMIADGDWIAEHPERSIRGYQINALYYPLGLGPRWLDLVQMWLAAQNDPGKLQTFINERLAETWEDPSMRAVRNNVIAGRAEPYRLRTAPEGVLAITAGVDTQDDRLAVHITGWGVRMAFWTLDYIELPGDPADEAVWVALTDLLNRPIEHANGGFLKIEATAIDAGGHRTEDVKNYIRRRMIRRPMCIFGAKPNNAPVLSKGTMQDVNWRGKYDKRGVIIHHVGTVAIKHWLYSRLSTDAEKQADARNVHLSEDLSADYFAGLVSETYNPRKNRFEKRGSVRNEPLDTWVYSYAAAHHPELRLHRLSHGDWEIRAARIVPPNPSSAHRAAHPSVPPSQSPRNEPPSATPARGGFGRAGWGFGNRD